MRKTIFKSLLILGLCAAIYGSAQAQAPARKPHRELRGFGYIGLSLPSPEGAGLGMVGGGLEKMVRESLGLGGEFGYIGTPTPNLTRGGFQLSPTLSYQFHRGKTGLKELFVVGGPAIFILPGRTAGGVTFGVGLHHWISEHIAIKAEIRNHYVAKESLDPNLSGRINGHNLGFRLGLYFR
ncbi:MAG TPA: outer membrane beta-barrel protein [Blastocatellia bacterium]|nr:outer membrane beta-barrel protein [Blastocatellia bacterium]